MFFFGALTGPYQTLRFDGACGLGVLFCDLFDCCVCSFIVSSPLSHPVVAIPPTTSAIVVVVVVVVVSVVDSVVVIVVVAYYPPLRVIYLIVVCMSLSLVMSSPCCTPTPSLRVVC